MRVDLRKAAAVASIVGLTSCGSVTEPAPAANTTVGLRVWAELSTDHVAIGDTTAELTVRVLARNPSRSTIRIAGGPPYVFTSDPADSRGLQQAFRIATAANPLNAGPSVDFWGQPEYVFAPLETQVATHQLSLRAWADGGWPLVPGSYQVRSYFNGHEGAPAVLHLVR